MTLTLSRITVLVYIKQVDRQTKKQLLYLGKVTRERNQTMPRGGYQILSRVLVANQCARKTRSTGLLQVNHLYNSTVTSFYLLRKKRTRKISERITQQIVVLHLSAPV